MAAAVFYTLYAGIFDRVTPLVWCCIGLIIFEGLVLLVCSWKCPLTLLGRKFTSNHSVGFDIFLPVWMAQHNKTIFTTLFVIGVALVLWRAFT